jgi:glucokinase
MGIGCPGPLDQARGIVQSPPNLPQWADFPLADRLRDALGVPVALENDANAGALGEALDGAGRGARTVLYVTISTGIGVGIVIDGRIHRGAHGLAGEVWAFCPNCFASDGPAPNVTDLASGNGLVSLLRGRVADGYPTCLRPDDADMPAILEACAGGDPAACALVADAQRTLAATISFCLHLLDPDVVVLGGGLCTDESWFVAPVRDLVACCVALPALARTPIRRADLWSSAVLHGALALGLAPRIYPIPSSLPQRTITDAVPANAGPDA